MPRRLVLLDVGFFVGGDPIGRISGVAAIEPALSAGPAQAELVLDRLAETARTAGLDSVHAGVRLAVGGQLS
jgi:hypothetical protein